MKTKEELNVLKEKAETVSKKLHELTEDELAQVVGGYLMDVDVPHKYNIGQSFSKYENYTNHNYTIAGFSMATGELRYGGALESVSNYSRFTNVENSRYFTEAELDAFFPAGPTA